MVNDPVLAFGVGILFGAILCKVLIESARDPHSPTSLHQSYPPQSILINNYVGKQSFEESMQSFDDDNDGWDDFDDDKDDPTELHDSDDNGMDDDRDDDDDGEEWKKTGRAESEDSFDEDDWRKTGDH